MAIQGALRLDHTTVFPNGAFVVGEVSAVEDFDVAQAAKESSRSVDTQARDKATGLRLWQVRVVDADQDARKGQVEVVVKIAAEHQPVPPALCDGMPFRPVEFDGLTATPWIDESRSRPRIAWSFRASGMRAPAASKQVPGQTAGKGLRSAPTAPSDDGKVA